MNGLEALKSVSQMVNTGLDYTQEDKEKEVTIIEKELKALEIIKEKYVNPILIKDEERVVGYNERVAFFPTMKLTKDEFDLLKEVLG